MSKNTRIEYRDNTKKFFNAYEEAIYKRLFSMGAQAETYAKENTPIDTGRLRNSITFAIEGEQAHIKSYKRTYKKPGEKKLKKYEYNGTAPSKNTNFPRAVYIGTNVEYAPYVELGARGRAGVHMLQRAVTEHKNKYQKIFESEMKNAK